MYTKPEYATMPRAFATIYKEGGLVLFWKGLVPRMTRIICESRVLVAPLRSSGAGAARCVAAPTRRWMLWCVMACAGATFILNYIRTNTVAYL